MPLTILLLAVAAVLAQEETTLRIRAESEDTVVRLSWDAPPGRNAEAYKVFVLGSERPLAVTPTPEFDDIGLSNGTTYRYRIIAVLESGDEWSGYQPVAATPQSTPVRADEIFAVDEHVVARFEFNGDINDSSGHERHVRLLGGEFVDTPWGQGLLVRDAEETGLDWSRYAGLLAPPYTVEIVLTPRGTGSWGKLFSFDDAHDNGWYYKDEGIQAYPHGVLAAGRVKADQRHYIAFVSTGADGIDVFFQGRKVGSTHAGFTAPPQQAVLFSDDTHTSRGEQIDAVIEAMRISKKARTEAEFAATQARLE